MQSDLERFAGLPEVVLRATGQVLNRRPRLLTPVFGPLQRAFSGTSWYFSQAAMLDSVLDGAFVLNSKYDLNLRQAGALWKLRRLFEGKKVGGFKFSPRFHDIAWADNIRPLADTVIINNAQIYSGNFIQQHARLNITPCFYIDGTLTEYFHGYSEFEGQTYGADVVQRAIELERESYACAERVIAMSRATVRNLVEVYGVSPDRVAMVMPAANLEDKVVPPPSEHQGWVGNEFTVGFVGLYPLRKGLDKLAKATQMLRGRGLPIRLRVIGRCPSDIAAMDGVEL